MADHLPYEKCTDRISINNFEKVLNYYRPGVIINCIGKTGRPNIDWCESNKEETYFTNVTLPLVMANECSKRNIHFVNIASGCIFYGESPNAGGWIETDFANPQSYYSKTKYACDLTIGDLSNVTTLRIRMPISSKNSQRNFINKIRGYSKVIDIKNSVTFMDDLVRCIGWVSDNSIFGTYNVTNPEPITAAQVLKEFQKHREHNFQIIDESELDKLTAAKRSNCILSSAKLNSKGFYMTPSIEALESCMNDYIKNI